MAIERSPAIFALFAMMGGVAWMSGATAFEREPTAAPLEAPISLNQQTRQGEPEWPWYLPPPDPSDPPLPEGLPNIRTIHLLGAQLAQSRLVGHRPSDMAAAHDWKAPNWCVRWEDGCEVCERTTSRSKSSCRPNKRWQASGTPYCTPNLGQTLCTGVDVMLFEKSCLVPHIAIYTNKIGISGNFKRRKILTYRISYFPMSIVKDEFAIKAFSADDFAKFVNLKSEVLSIKYDINNIKKVTEANYIASGYYMLDLVQGAADKYFFFRLEFERFFACEDRYLEGN